MPADVEIGRLELRGIDAHLDEIVAVYAAALGAAPAAVESFLADVLPVHRERRGFRLVAAREPAVVGFGYGYAGERGQWWTERVARAMSRDEQARWLDVPHFEVVELHVRPERQRQGIGGRLLGELLRGVDFPFALLSTWESNGRGLAFYAKHGWTEIVRGVEFGSERGPYTILARELPQSALPLPEDAASAPE